MIARPEDSLILGVDGGGTSTVARLADAAGTVLGQGIAGASNPKAIGFDAAFAALETAIDEAFSAASLTRSPVAAACLGLAGFAQAEDRQRLLAWSDRIKLTNHLLPVSDGALVLAAGTPDGWGVAVIAGTGSIAVGADSAGQTARSGGWGYLMGDEGSAYNVVLAALRRCARRADGREPGFAADLLTARFLTSLHITASSELISALHAPGMDRTRIAALAPVVLDAARLDPTITTTILHPAGIDLAETVAAVARQLGWSSGDLPLALAGGFLLRADPVRQSLLDHLTTQGYQPIPQLVTDPVTGALILARRAIDCDSITRN